MTEPKSRGKCFTCLGEVWDWMPYTIDNDGILQHKDPGYCIQPLKGQITALREQLEQERMPEEVRLALIDGMKWALGCSIQDGWETSATEGYRKTLSWLNEKAVK